MESRPRDMTGRVLDFAPPQPWSVDGRRLVWGLPTVLTVSFSPTAPDLPAGLLPADSLFDVTASMAKLLRDRVGPHVSFLPLRRVQISSYGAMSTIHPAVIESEGNNFVAVFNGARVDVTEDTERILRCRQHAIWSAALEYTQPEETWTLRADTAWMPLPGAYPAVGATTRESAMLNSEVEPISALQDDRVYSLIPSVVPRRFSIEVFGCEPALVVVDGRDDRVTVTSTSDAHVSAPHMSIRSDGTCVVEVHAYGGGEVVLQVPFGSDVVVQSYSSVRVIAPLQTLELRAQAGSTATAETADEVFAELTGNCRVDITETGTFNVTFQARAGAVGEVALGRSVMAPAVGEFPQFTFTDGDHFIASGRQLGPDEVELDDEGEPMTVSLRSRPAFQMAHRDVGTRRQA